MIYLRLFVLPLSLMLFACASNEPKPPKTSEIFYTLTTPDGTKQFSYTLTMAHLRVAGKATVQSRVIVIGRTGWMD